MILLYYTLMQSLEWWHCTETSLYIFFTSFSIHFISRTITVCVRACKCMCMCMCVCFCVWLCVCGVCVCANICMCVCVDDLWVSQAVPEWAVLIWKSACSPKEYILYIPSINKQISVFLSVSGYVYACVCGVCMRVFVCVCLCELITLLESRVMTSGEPCPSTYTRDINNGSSTHSLCSRNTIEI